MNNSLPLTCKIRKGAIDMGVGVDVLKFAAENHPDFWDGMSGVSTPNLRIVDQEEFAKDVVREINREAEDGSTPLSRMLDQMISAAVNNGSLGVEE